MSIVDSSGTILAGWELDWLAEQIGHRFAESWWGNASWLCGNTSRIIATISMTSITCTAL